MLITTDYLHFIFVDHTKIKRNYRKKQSKKKLNWIWRFACKYYYLWYFMKTSSEVQLTLLKEKVGLNSNGTKTEKLTHQNHFGLAPFKNVNSFLARLSVYNYRWKIVKKRIYSHVTAFVVAFCGYFFWMNKKLSLSFLFGNCDLRMHRAMDWKRS